MEQKTTILGLFYLPNRSFHIPAYQRAYSWEKEKNLEQFFNDLTDQPKDKPYYLGHFLFEKLDNSEKYAIIDGQQRMTTVVVFFSCMFDILSKRDDLPKDFDFKDEIGFYLRKGDIIKLKTVDYDNNFFQNYIIDRNKISETPDTSSQSRITDAKTFFTEKLQKLTTVEIIKLKSTLQSADITTFVVGSKEQAAQIFEFQNDRGKDLTNVERLKAFFIYQIYLNIQTITDDIQFIENEFKAIYEQTEKIEMFEDDVLNYYCRAFYFGYHHENVVKEIKKRFKNEKDKNNWIKQFCSGLRKAFKDIAEMQKYTNENQFSYLRDLRYLGRLALCYPFLLKGWHLPQNDRERLFHFLENIVFRLKLINSRAEIESRLNHFLINFSDVDTLVNEVKVQIRTNWWWFNYWGDNAIHDYINSGGFYNNPVDSYLLWKYESSLKGNGYYVSFDTVEQEQVEHISPQTPTDNEPVANGYNEYTDEFKSDWLNCLGNIMLISKSNNCSLGNKPFADKLASYETNTALSQHLEIKSFVSDTNKPVWDIVAIEKRHKKLFEFALNYWNMDNI